MRSVFSAGIPLVLGRSLFPILFACLFQHQGKAQPFKTIESLFVTTYGLEDGLQQSMVSQVRQDNRGLIWMVTGDGLHCFDGREFKVFRISFKGVYNNSDNMMRMLVETEPGSFIISSASRK